MSKITLESSVFSAVVWRVTLLFLHTFPKCIPLLSSIAFKNTVYTIQYLTVYCISDLQILHTEYLSRTVYLWGYIRGVRKIRIS